MTSRGSLPGLRTGIKECLDIRQRGIKDKAARLCANDFGKALVFILAHHAINGQFRLWIGQQGGHIANWMPDLG